VRWRVQRRFRRALSALLEWCNKHHLSNFIYKYLDTHRLHPRFRAARAVVVSGEPEAEEEGARDAVADGSGVVGEVFGDLIIEGRVGWGEGVGSDAVRGRCLRERVGRGGLPGGASRVAHWAERGCDWAGGVLAFTIKEEEWMEAWVVVETVRDWKHTEQMGVPRMLRVYCARGCVNRHRGVVDISPCVGNFECSVHFNSKRNFELK